MPKTNRTLNEQFEFQGIWFFPEAKKNTIYGSVEYSRGNIHLEITKIIKNTDVNNLSQAKKFQQDHIPIILGVAHTGEKITLQDCILREKSTARIDPSTYDGKTTLQNGTPAQAATVSIQSRYRIHQMFIGEHYSSYEDVKFDSVSTDFSSLGTWYTRSSISVEPPSLENILVKIDYNGVEPTMAKINDEYELELHCSPSFTRKTYKRSYSINEYVSLLIKKREQQEHYEKLDDIIQGYRFFLMLATMHTVHPIRITGCANKQQVEIYPNIRLGEKIQENVWPEKMLFTFNYIEESFADKIQKWRKLWEIYKDPFKRYFLALLDQERITIDSQFLSIAIALEAYHKLKCCHEKEFKENFKKMVNELIEKRPLEIRLLHITEIAPEAFEDGKNEKSEFASKVRVTRNYYAHGISQSIYEVTDPHELSYLTQEMKLLMEGCLLRELCFSQEQIEEMMKHNREVRNYARDHPLE